MRRLALQTVLITCVAAAPAWGQEPPQLVQFLQQNIGLDSAQLSAVGSGKAVVKVLDTKEKRDVAVFGIIAVDVPRAAYIGRVRDFGRWLQTPERRRFALFSDPATLADVQAVTIDSGDVAVLKDCHPGSCKMKLPAMAMQALKEKIDWSAPNPGAQVSEFARQLMVRYVTDYRARGDSAMVVYDDHGNVRASDAFSALLAQSPFLYQFSAPFHDYLANYPHTQLAGVSDVIFWADEAMSGLRPILSINHAAVYSPPDLPGVTFVAGKQIYADHYFEAAFELLAVVDRASATGKPGIYLVGMRRFRFDDLPSGGLMNIRGKVVGKLRDKTRADLEREKATSEH
jgi:hypothetical protein